MKKILIVVLVIIQSNFLFGLRVEVNYSSSDSLKISKLVGIWEVSKICLNGDCKIDPLNNCNERDELEIYPNPRKIEDTIITTLYDQRLIIGRRDYKTCEVDPISFKYEISINACYDDLIIDLKQSDIGYIYGEGTILICSVKFEKETLVIHELIDMVTYELIDRMKIYKKSDVSTSK